MNVQKYIPLLARTAIAVIFLHSGVGKISNFAGTQEQIAGAGLPLAPLVTVFTILFLFVGSISLIVGYKARIGAGLLLAFLIPATLVFHNFIADPIQLGQFMKNLAIIGGLLMVTAYGSGPLSLDYRATAPISAPSSSRYSEESVR
ncbi:MAG: DoxX family protein [Cyanobacteria bacterium J06638_22]